MAKIKLKAIEDRIKLLGTLKFNNANVPKSVKDCIHKTIKDENDMQYAGRSTYYSKNNKRQCDYNKLRGICDIYRVVLYYFPTTSLKSVLDVMNDVKYHSGYCNATAQTVFNKSTYTFFNRVLPDYTVIRTKKFGGNVELANTDYYDEN